MCSQKGTPWIIPDIVLRFVTDLEADNRPCFWKIQKCENKGLSVTVTFPANKSKSGQRNVVKVKPGKRANATNSSEPTILQRKTKTPSSKRRDFLRRKIWIQRKIAAKLPPTTSPDVTLLTSPHSDPVGPADSEIHVTNGNSIELETEELSPPSQSDHNELEVKELSPPSHSEPTEVEIGSPVSPSHDTHLCDPSENTATLDTSEQQNKQAQQLGQQLFLTAQAMYPSREASDSDSDFNSEWGDSCTYCQKESETKGQYKRCSRCLFVRYCSRTCQVAHWTSHKAACNIMQAGPGHI